MKFICNGCANGQGDPCILDVGNDNSVTLDSLRCVLTDDHYCDWQKYDDSEVANLQPEVANLQPEVANLQPEVAKLPKLTAEVFDRHDCPEWAKYAAVDKYRNAMWYEGEPKVVGSVFWNSQRGQIQEITGKFDASDWQNSLIERPAAKLPDWCKVGEWVYDEHNGYGRVIATGPCTVEFDYCKFYTAEGSRFDRLKEARLRPYNAGEIPDLPFEVTERNSNFRTTVVSCQGNNVWLAGASTAISTEELMRDFTAKGELCGCLEHLENGEWVR